MPLRCCTNTFVSSYLQLAAELGKTLLERNKELEASLKHHQNIIDDHVQEIEYLTKQNAALREVNDSRMKIYEQLEVSIQDLERDKYKLALDYQAEKKHVKQLCCNIESLETKVEELSRSLEDARRQVEAERRSKQTERLAGAQQPPPPQLTFSLVSPASKDAKSSTVHANTTNTATCPTQGSGNGDGPDSRQATESVRHVASSGAPTTNRWLCFFCPLQCQKPNVSSPKSTNGPEAHHPAAEDALDGSEPGRTVSVDEYHMTEENEEMLRMAQELQQTQRCLLSEQSKVGELEEQLASIAQENQLLQSKLVHANTAEDMKSVHDELSVLAEFRQGQVCTRCMRGFDDQPDTDSIITGTEDDDTSLLELINNTETPRMYCSSVTLEIAPAKPDSLDLSLSDCAGPTNPYRELVEKYEALLEVHRQPMMRKASQVVPGSGNNTPVDSCQPQQLLPPVVEGGQDEQQAQQPRYMIEFNPPTGASQAGGEGRTGAVGGDAMESRPGGQSAVGARAVGGSEYSEAETASSGYSDEVSNKATQTDESPKNFLCTIADGKDWRFSIYEDPSAIDSRFRFSPSHRELFREIFSVLKKAAENRDEGDQLPLLDDAKPLVGAGKPGATSVPPVTPANEEPPAGFPHQEQEQDPDDDTVSFISSSAVSEQSLAMSECITKSERRRIARQAKCAAAAASRGYMGEEENRPPLDQQQQQQQQQQHVLPDGRVLIPYKQQQQQQPLEYISVTVGKRKSRRRSHREPGTPQSGAAATPPRPPSSSGRKHRTSFRPWNPDMDATTPTGAEWNGNSMTVYNRSRGSSGAPPPASHTPTSGTPGGAKGGRTRSRTSKSRDKQQQRHAIADLATSHNRYAELAVGGDATAAAVGGGGGGGDDLVVEFKPSTASQHLHKLQKLDLSYAEVLRRADTCQPYNTRRQQTRQQQQHHY
ncbi:AGAP000264-PA-like protein [Anopheles sinensis]|uniref:AGAP000264-PA-like protein n=1 Tax=Anopheles sinensis TaxID=74873 RepID=A0A084VX75_ANOSI|nr:AGAP000264-PA-like protein [Anopheles sinensis]